MESTRERRDHSEFALRWLAVLLGGAVLLGAAACGGDEEIPEVVAEVSVAETPVRVADQRAEDEADRGEGQVSATDDPGSTVGVVDEVDREVTYEEAESAFHAGEYGRSVDLFTRYTLQKPDNSWGYYMLGIAAWKAGHNDVAETALRESTTRSPNHVKGHVNLARVLLEEGRAEEALEHATIAEDIDPASGQAKRMLARALTESGDLDGAMVAYEQALWIDADDERSLNNLGYLLLQRGRFEEAVGPLALAAQLDSTNTTFRNNLGSALEGAGFPVAALEAFGEAVAADPTNDKAGQSVARLQEVVINGAIPEVDVLALGGEYRDRIVGALAESNDGPGHGEGSDAPPGEDGEGSHEEEKKDEGGSGR